MTESRAPREWGTFQYFDAKDVLRKLRQIENDIASRPMDDKVRHLRTGGLRPYNERRQAALFCYGMGCRIGSPVEYAPVEREDFDCVARWKDGETTRYARIQTKEFVPADLNPESSLQGEIDKLSKYSDSADLTVAIYLNHRARIDFTQLTTSGLRIGELWLFGQASSDREQWLLYGDVLSDPRGYTFEYPT